MIEYNPVLTEDKISPGAIILTQDNDIVARGIVAVTKDDNPDTDDNWSHAAFAVCIYEGQLNVLQAVGSGVEMPSFDNFRKHLTHPALVLYPVQPVYPDFTGFNKFALRVQGDKYAYTENGIVAFAGHALLGLDRSTLSDGDTPAAWFCSQLGCHAWRTEQGVDLVPYIPNHYSSPNDLYRSADLKTIGCILPVVWPPKEEPIEGMEG